MRQSKQVLKWAGVVAVVVAILYAMSQSSWVPYDEDDMAAVDFSSLDSSDRRTAVREANEARCPCGCGMTLARCVATDSTCPLRNQNIERINVMVKAAAND